MSVSVPVLILPKETSPANLNKINSRWIFVTKLEISKLEIPIKHELVYTSSFGIDWYTYLVHLAIFQFIDPEMTSEMTSDDLEMHFIECRKKNSNRTIYISCIFDIKVIYLPFCPFGDRNPFITAMKLPETTHFRWFSTKWNISYHHISSDPPEIAGHIENLKNSRDSRVEIKFWQYKMKVCRLI